ncbi:hypothetical protein [Mesorhizobium sp. AR10]|nr:hypothetical protein [Mesorhizobium sp. AR10]
MHSSVDTFGGGLVQGTPRLLENWIDEDKKSVRFLFETLRGSNG